MSFKGVSANTQSRVDRNAVHNRSNESGVDTSSFQGKVQESLESRERRIKQEKTTAETRLSMLNTSIAQAKNGFTRNSRDQTGYDFVARSESQRSALIRKVGWCQRQLEEIKREKLDQKINNEEDEQQFPDVFMELAKEMLAEPVYNRIMVAAVHRQRGASKR